MISSLQSLQSQFEKLDASGDGLLNQQELIGALQRAGIELNSEQIDSVWRIVDEDQVNPNKNGRDFFVFERWVYTLFYYFQSGAVEYQEFISVFIGEMDEDRVNFVHKSWRKLDPKGNGVSGKYDAQKVFR